MYYENPSRRRSDVIEQTQSSQMRGLGDKEFGKENSLMNSICEAKAARTSPNDTAASQSALECDLCLFNCPPQDETTEASDLETKLLSAFSNSPYREIRELSVCVTQDDHVAILGETKSYYLKQVAQEIVRCRAPMCQIYNQIHVRQSECEH